MVRIVSLLLVFAYSASALAQSETNPTLWKRFFGAKETTTAPAPAEKKTSTAPKRAVKKDSSKKPAPAKTAPSLVPLNAPEALAESSEANKPESSSDSGPNQEGPAPGPSPIRSAIAPSAPNESNQSGSVANEPSFWQRIFRGASSTGEAAGAPSSPSEQESPSSTANLRTEDPPQPISSLQAAPPATSAQETSGPSLWQRLFGGAASTPPTSNEAPSPTPSPIPPNAATVEIHPVTTPPTATPRAAENNKTIDSPSIWQRLFGGAAPTTSPPSKAAPKSAAPSNTSPNAAANEAASTTIALPSALDQAPSTNEKKTTFGLANVCQQSRCDLMVLFDAPINKSTVEQFEQDTSNLPTGTVVLLNSTSGDLNSGIRLGQIFRQKRLNTRVGVAKLNRSVLTETDGKCFSACALAFVGGINRTLDPNDQFGVYAVRSTSKTISETDYRQALANLGLYIEQMGIDRRLIDQIEQIQGNNLELINYNTARLLNIDNNKRLPSSAWRMQALDDGLLIALISTRQNSGQFNVTLGITRDANQFRLTVFFKPQATTANLAQIAEFLNKNTRLRIVAGKQTVNPSTLKPWTASGTGVQTALALNNTEIMLLSSVLDFELNLSTTSKNSVGIDPSTVFGTMGLKGAIAALKK